MQSSAFHLQTESLFSPLFITVAPFVQNRRYYDPKNPNNIVKAINSLISGLQNTFLSNNEKHLLTFLVPLVIITESIKQEKPILIDSIIENVVNFLHPKNRNEVMNEIKIQLITDIDYYKSITDSLYLELFFIEDLESKDLNYIYVTDSIKEMISIMLKDSNHPLYQLNKSFRESTQLNESLNILEECEKLSQGEQTTNLKVIKFLKSISQPNKSNNNNNSSNWYSSEESNDSNFKTDDDSDMNRAIFNSLQSSINTENTFPQNNNRSSTVSNFEELNNISNSTREKEHYSKRQNQTSDEI
jgi:hypothetical protein